jgi:sphinganine-1-phosphate aldolase
MPSTLPPRGLAEADVLAELSERRRDDADWEHGRTFSLVYYAGEAHQRLLEKAHTLYAATNALSPLAFRSLRRLEAEVVRMTATMLGGDRDVVGTMTSGGTESILLAVQSSRDRARAHRPKIVRPNMVVPETAHVAFDKAAAYFGVEIRYAKLRADLRADVRDMASLVDGSTVLLVGSAPQYPHGVVDPIEEIAELGLRKRIPLHVDACIGAFVLPWVERLGHPIPRWDFRVPGVTSISADVHKYGFASKGASTILYRDMSYLRHQFFVSTDWPGGIYASPSIQGTRSGGAIAAAWASIVALGESGFLAHTEKALAATHALVAGIEGIPELEVMGKPDATIVSWRARKSSAIDTYVLADRLEDRDWNVDRQQNPPSIHCTVTSNHAAVVDEYVGDLREAVRFVQAHPDLQSRGNAAMYGMMAKVPFRGMVKKTIADVMEKMYGPDAADPSFDPFGHREEEEGAMMRMVKSYGGRALGLLERLEEMRATLGFGKKRRTR